jgi:membrane-bound lytic murein transglycosylase MltF
MIKKIIKIGLWFLFPVMGLAQNDMGFSTSESVMEIGTAEKPTFDGGIINAADSNAKYKNKVRIAKFNNEDSWATTERIQQFFEVAMKNGKLEFVLEEAKKQNLPPSVAAVPFIESFYNDKAISSKGAAGAWQIMPALAQDFGLSLENRFQFREATPVALSYLKALYNEFGNWDLAYAAYNAGETRVKNALRKNPDATSIMQLALPQETKDYVARLRTFNKALISLGARIDEKPIS